MDRTALIKFSVPGAESQSYSVSDLLKITRVELGQGERAGCVEFVADVKALNERSVD